MTLESDSRQCTAVILESDRRENTSQCSTLVGEHPRPLDVLMSFCIGYLLGVYWFMIWLQIWKILWWAMNAFVCDGLKKTIQGILAASGSCLQCPRINLCCDKGSEIVLTHQAFYKMTSGGSFEGAEVLPSQSIHINPILYVSQLLQSMKKKKQRMQEKEVKFFLGCRQTNSVFSWNNQTSYLADRF